MAVIAASAVAVSSPPSADGHAVMHGCSPAITVTWRPPIDAETVRACRAPPPPRPPPSADAHAAGVDCWSPLRLLTLACKVVEEMSGGKRCCQCRRCEWTGVSRWASKRRDPVQLLHSDGHLCRPTLKLVLIADRLNGL